MDPRLGDFNCANVLVEDSRIVAVAPSLMPVDARVTVTGYGDILTPFLTGIATRPSL
jgi:3D (Asp-Asp-Asp) domain-containing protein